MKLTSAQIKEVLSKAEQYEKLAELSATASAAIDEVLKFAGDNSLSVPTSLGNISSFVPEEYNWSSSY